MIWLEQIDANHSDYYFVERLLHSSFPKEERRPDVMQRHNTLYNDKFHTLLIREDDKYVGLLSYWDFNDFRYIEHFAVDARHRGSGIGANALKLFIKRGSSPVVLEVEPEGSTQMASRRIEFYRRNGFELWRTPYVQPPYRPCSLPLPLSLMSTAGLDETKAFSHIQRVIHHEVYGL